MDTPCPCSALEPAAATRRPEPRGCLHVDLRAPLPGTPSRTPLCGRPADASGAAQPPLSHALRPGLLALERPGPEAESPASWDGIGTAPTPHRKEIPTPTAPVPMRAEILTALLVLAILGAVLLSTDFLGRPDLLLDSAVFVTVTAVFAVRLWLRIRLGR